MRRLPALLALLMALALAAPASAQQPEGAVRLTLVSGRPYATPDQPLRLQVRAVNESATTFGDLRVSLSVYPAARSRSEYDVALDAEPAVIELATTTYPVQGTLEPGESRTVTVESGLGFLEEEFAGNSLHPVQLELASEFAPIAALRTAVMFIREDPNVPLNVALTFVLDAPLRLLPDGRFTEGALEDEIASGSRLDAIVSALADVPAPATLVVSPLLLRQLQAMADGYQVVEGGSARRVPADDPLAERAKTMLARIQSVARDDVTEVVALPFAVPSVPALVGAGLHDDLEAQVLRGRVEVERLLGVEPVGLFHPPGSALTPDVLPALAGIGVTNVVVGPRALPPPQGLKFTSRPTAQLSGEGASVVAITPDPVLDLRITDEEQPAVLRAHRTLGELSAIYGERPSKDRGVSLIFDGDEVPKPAFLRSLFRGLVRTPEAVQWLRAVKATRLLQIPPAEGRELAPVREAFSETFLGDLVAAEDDVAEFAAAAAEPTSMRDHLETQLLLSEHRGFLPTPDRALAFVGRVRALVAAEFAKLELPPTNSVTTLTSQAGAIPLTIHNLADYDMRVLVRLVSPVGPSRLQFVGGPVREVVLSQPTQQLTFPVRTQTTGRFPVRIEVMTPRGDLIGSSQIVVRSTAYNRIALIVTIGAALFLAALWARRFLPRPG